MSPRAFRLLLVGLIPETREAFLRSVANLADGADRVWLERAIAAQDTDMAGTAIEEGWPDSRVIWPNLPEADVDQATLPRVEVAFIPIEPQQLALKAGGTNRRRFLYQATVVTEERSYQWPAQRIADKIVARFEAGTHPTAGLWVRAKPTTGPGVVAEREWRLPVTIRLEALAK